MINNNAPREVILCCVKKCIKRFLNSICSVPVNMKPTFEMLLSRYLRRCKILQNHEWKVIKQYNSLNNKNNVKFTIRALAPFLFNSFRVVYHGSTIFFLICELFVLKNWFFFRMCLLRNLTSIFLNSNDSHALEETFYKD